MPINDEGGYVQYKLHESDVRLRNQKLFKTLGSSYFIRDACSEKELFQGARLFEDILVDEDAVRRDDNE